MLLYVFNYLANFASEFSAFSSITLRGILSGITALLLSFMLGSKVIRWLAAFNIGQSVRDDGPQSHLAKAGTPTMGGALILMVIVIATLLWSDLTNIYVWVLLFALVSFGAIGWVDDYKKIKYKNSDGLSAKAKYFWQSLSAILIVVFLYWYDDSNIQTTLLFPVFKNIFVDMGWFFIPFAYVVIVGASNSVNLTDGLDGLAIMPCVMVAGGLAIFAYAAGNIVYSNYLSIPYVAGAGEIIVFISALMGAGLGFLWFNTYPAQVFMGDVGALALGAALGVIAIIVRQEIVLLIMGGVFVMETVSVILQVGSFKLMGKRIFRMAPLHHHFELKGWPEPKVIVRFWIATVLLVLIGLATLKIR